LTVLACRGAAPEAAERRALDASSSLGFHVAVMTAPFGLLKLTS
jgi:hypothetical protein